MAKKIGVLLMGIFVVVVVGFNLYNFFGKDSSGSMSGQAISGLPSGLNVSLIAFILQWVVLLVIVIFAYSRFLKHRKEEDQKISDFVLPKPTTKAQTNIDFFYDLIKEKKSLTTGTIAKAFGIKKEQVLEWGKILEEHDLVSIEYPAFADPEIRLNEGKTEEQKKAEEKEEKKKEEKEKEKKKDEKKKEDEKQKEDKKPEEKNKISDNKEAKTDNKGREMLAKKLEEMENKNQNTNEENLDQYKKKK